MNGGTVNLFGTYQHGTFNSARVNIIAHSMGGLDARYMVSRLGMDDRVEALIAIAHPNFRDELTRAALA